MPTDPLDECRARWRGAIPLGDVHLAEALRRQCDADTISMLVAEILRLRDVCTAYRILIDDRGAEIARLTQNVAEWKCVDQSWQAAWRSVWCGFSSQQWGRELWLACWMVASKASRWRRMRALYDATTGVIR